MIRPSTLLLSSQQFERNQLCMLLAPPCGGAPQLLKSSYYTTSSSTTTTIHQRSAHIGASAAAPHAQPMNYLRQHTVRVFQFGLLVRVFLLLTSYIHTTHNTLGMTRLLTSGSVLYYRVSLSPSRVHLEDVSLRDFRSQIYLCYIVDDRKQKAA